MIRKELRHLHFGCGGRLSSTIFRPGSAARSGARRSAEKPPARRVTDADREGRKRR